MSVNTTVVPIELPDGRVRAVIERILPSVGGGRFPVKRAEALLRAVQLYGVKLAQMDAVSWGEEWPKAAGHDEAARAQNRRDDRQYPKQ